MGWREKLLAALTKADEADPASSEPVRHQFRPTKSSIQPSRPQHPPLPGLPGGTPLAFAGAPPASSAPPSGKPAPTVEVTTDRDDHLTQLFHSALTAETSQALIEFTEFSSRFRRHSIFNARLIQTQRRGAKACATAKEWRAVGRYVLPDAQPIIILWPFGPIAHVYDVEDTGPPHDRHAIGDPFGAITALDPGRIVAAIDRLVKACAAGKLFHVAVTGARLGFDFAGSAVVQGQLPLILPEDAAEVAHGKVRTTLADPRRSPSRANKPRWIPSWRVKLNDRMTPAEQLVTLAHELGYIFCGHLGGCEGHGATSGWPARGDVGHHEREIEAEAVAALVAQRRHHLELGRLPASSSSEVGDRAREHRHRRSRRRSHRVPGRTSLWGMRSRSDRDTSQGSLDN